MDKTLILGTGLSGMVGTRVVELLSPFYEFQNLSLETGFDITEYDSVQKTFNESEAKIILHMAAKTDVDSCEDDKILGEEGQAWMVNVEGTRNIVDAAKKTGKNIIYISTDFVFDGATGNYKEDDEPNPVNWYGTTKYEGEVLVKEASKEFTIVRIASPYCAIKALKPDFVHRIIDRLNEKQPVTGVKDHIFTPTYIDDIAKALGVLIQKNLSGIYHVTGGSNISPLEAVKEIAKTLHLPSENITETSRSLYFSKDRAYRPFNLSLNNDKITRLGIHMRTFNEGLKQFSI